MKRPTVAILTSAEGHYSIALAAQQALGDEYEVVIFKQPIFMQSLYKVIYRFLPGVYIVPFLAGKNKQIFEFVQNLAVKKYQAELRRFLQQHQPVACINTYFMYLKPLELLQAEMPFKLINILADPRSIHPLLIANPPIVNLAFDDDAETFCKKYRPDSIHQTAGWFVQSAFEQPYDKTAIRNELKLPTDRFTVLITGGSEGSSTVTRLISQLKDIQQPVTLIMVCGSNKLLFQEVKLISKQLTQNPHIHIECVGFTTDMHRYMKAADLVVGKAGPNSIFEATATGTPFFAITHISGQEDGNLEVIKQYHLGVVEEDVKKAGLLLRDMIEHPKQLEEFQPHLKKMAEYNKQAKAQLLQLVRRQLDS